MREMRLTRAGVFKVLPEQGTNCQCVVKGHTTYYFKCVVTFRDPVLDKRGFLIDQSDLGAIIEEYYTKDSTKKIPSCELMVDELSVEVANRLWDCDMPAYSVYIEITNIPQGSQGYISSTYYPSRNA